MNSVQRASVSFGVSVLLGALLFLRQNRQLGELQSLSESSPSPAIADAPHPLVPAAEEPDSPLSDPGAWFVETLEQKLLTLLDAEEVAGYLANQRAFESMAITAKLTDEERDVVWDGLKSYDLERAGLFLDQSLTTAARTVGLDGIQRREDEWLARLWGKERHDAFLVADELQQRASAERRATAAVARIDSDADLTDAQKEALQAEFVERAHHPATPPEKKFVVGLVGRISRGPSAPDISSEAEDILTPAQWQDYRKQQKATVQSDAQRFEMLQDLMGASMPAVIEALEADR